MTTATAIGKVWEPQLAAHSLPGGLPFHEDQTPIMGRSANVLLRAQPTAFGDIWFGQPIKELSGRRWVSASDEDETLRRMSTELILRVQAISNGILSADIERRAVNDPQLFDVIDLVKEQLGIEWDGLLEVLGVARRTFFTYRNAKVIPIERAVEVRLRLSLIQREIAESLDAARLAIRTQREQLAAVLEQGQFQIARDLFAACRAEIAAVRRAAWERARADVAGYLGQLRDVVAHPDFPEALAAAGFLFERTDALAGERLRALVELESVVGDAHSGADVPEAFEFLPTLSHADIDAFKERSAAFVQSPDFTPTAWQTFVAGEATRAWNAYQLFVLPADPVDALYLDEAEEDTLFSTLDFVPYSQRMSR